jgi:GTPase SAR1 family protein
MVEKHQELYQLATELNVQVAEFVHHYDELTEDFGNNVYVNATVEAALTKIRKHVGTILREIVADAFDEGELVFPVQAPVPEGAENVHRGQRMVERQDLLADLREINRSSSPVRMTSIL